MILSVALYAMTKVTSWYNFSLGLSCGLVIMIFSIMTVALIVYVDGEENNEPFI